MAGAEPGESAAEDGDAASLQHLINFLAASWNRAQCALKLQIEALRSGCRPGYVVAARDAAAQGDEPPLQGYIRRCHEAYVETVMKFKVMNSK